MIKDNSASQPEALRLAEAVRSLIVETPYQIGQSLPTHFALCEQFGVGLRRLREGLSILRQEGLIETRRRGGTIVTQPTLASLEAPLQWQLESRRCTFEDLVRARATVESAIVAEAARTRTQRDLLELLSLIEALESPGLSQEACVQADEQFHQALVTATHNPALRVFGQLISDQFRRKRGAKLRHTKALVQQSVEEHRVLFEALQKRRPEVARKQMHAHILRQLKVRPAKQH